MTISELLKIDKHRPWDLPKQDWKYYQEWNNAVFLHWQVDPDELKQFVPADLEIDLYEGKPWVSLVAFTMEKIRLRNLPSFPPISDFDEINIRTYVKYKEKQGVYFLSIEGGTRISCHIAKQLSDLPYRYSRIKQQKEQYCTSYGDSNERIELKYKVGKKIEHKTEKDKWLTERFALFQDTEESIYQYEIHHVPWPIFEIDINEINIDYPRFRNLINNSPALFHYSSGVQVIAWKKQKWKKVTISSTS